MLLLLAAVAQVSQASLPEQPTAIHPDSAVEALVSRARAHHIAADRSIAEYRAVVVDRATVATRILGIERLMTRRETAARIHWRREGVSSVQVVQAREVTPFNKSTVSVAGGLEDIGLPLFEPGSDRLLLNGIMSGGDDGSMTFIRHPLAPEHADAYRFAMGDTLTVTLPGGEETRLVGIEVRPVVDDAAHMLGTLWLDAHTHVLVRAVFRPASTLVLRKRERVLGFGSPGAGSSALGLLDRVELEIGFVSIDYGLWEGRWWMPRSRSIEAVASAGSLSATIRYEQAYSEYSIESVAPEDIATTTATPRPEAQANCGSDEPCRCGGAGCQRVEVVLPADTGALLIGEYLTEAVYSDDVSFIDGSDLGTTLARTLGRIPTPAAYPRSPVLAVGLGPDLLRYNRVEGLSPAASTRVDVGQISFGGIVRYGLASGTLDGRLWIQNDGATGALRLGAHHGLAAMNPDSGPLGLANSLRAFLVGDDDGEYYRRTGVDLAWSPSPLAGSPELTWRVYAERQRPAEAGASTTLFGTLEPLLAAAPADQVGAAVGFRRSRGFDPDGLRWGVRIDASAETGTYDFVRGAASVRADLPLSGGWSVGAEAAAGAAEGGVPLQAHFFLGGRHGVRGYDPAAGHGPAYARGRLELGSPRPFRTVLFGDIGRAWFPEGDGAPHRLAAVGIGQSFLDGLFRVDVARAVRSPIGWRLGVYFGGIL